MVTSLNKWLEVNVPSANAADFTYVFMAIGQAAMFPRIEVHPFDNPSPGINAFSALVFPHNTPDDQGRENVVMFEINLYTNSDQQDNALMHVRQLRDRMARGLVNAGRSRDDDDTIILPAIEVLDYDNAAASTGIILQPMVQDLNGESSKYFPPASDAPTIHRIQQVIRMKWTELIN